MMVHSWTTQHVRLSYKDKISGKEGFLDPAVSLTVFKITAIGKIFQRKILGIYKERQFQMGWHYTGISNLNCFNLGSVL